MHILAISSYQEQISTVLFHGLGKDGYQVSQVMHSLIDTELNKVQSPDLIIIDLALPAQDEHNLCSLLRKTYINCPILLLTTHKDQAAYLTPPGSYLIKPVSYIQLKDQIEAMTTNLVEQAKSSWLLVYGNLQLDLHSRTAWLGTQRLDLYNKELQLLECFMRQPGKLMTHQELNELIWPGKVNINHKNLQAHINSLRKKLGDRLYKPVYIENIPGHGYRFGPTPSLASEAIKDDPWQFALTGHRLRKKREVIRHQRQQKYP